MKIYKVYYRTCNGSESYTFIEADSKEMIVTHARTRKNAIISVRK